MTELFKGVKPEKKHKNEDEESDDDTDDSTPKHHSHDEDNPRPPTPPPPPKKAPSVPFWKKWFGGMRSEGPTREGEHLLCAEFGLRGDVCAKPWGNVQRSTFNFQHSMGSAPSEQAKLFVRSVT
jgi:hypothetical protein